MPISKKPRSKTAFRTSTKATAFRIDQVVAMGLRAEWMKDLYHYLLVLPWSAFIAGFSLVYLGLNLIFGALYLLGDGAVANARPGMFADAFFFSVETNRHRHFRKQP